MRHPIPSIVSGLVLAPMVLAPTAVRAVTSSGVTRLASSILLSLALSVGLTSAALGAVPASTATYTLSGAVTGLGGTGLSGIHVQAESATDSYYATTVAGGSYAVTLYAGFSYTLSYSDPNSTYLTGYYDALVPTTHFTLDFQSNTPVPVSGPVTGINVQLPTGNRITGTVTGTGGTGISGVAVDAHSPAYDGYATTNSSGAYSVTVAPNNPYTVSFRDPSGTYHSGYFDVLVPTTHFTATQSLATSIPVTTYDIGAVDVQMPLWPGATYHALTPARILDSRDGTGLSGAFSSHVARTFQVTGYGGVPSNATAVTGNLTVTGQTSQGFLFIGPNAANNPTSSTLNFPVGDDRANAVTVALSGTGTLSVTYAAPTAGKTAHVIFDVTGFFTPDTTGATYHALTPGRILDSRDGTGLAGVFSSHVARTFTVIGHGGVPAGATAVTGNLTVTGQNSQGFLYLGPIAANNPTSSTLNFPLNDDRANAVTVALSGSGTLSATYAAPTSGPTAHVIFDVTGYFTPDTTGAKYVPLSPARILDSRDGTGGLSGAFGSHVARTFTVIGHGGVPSNANAVTGNLTVTQQSSQGFLYLGPIAANNPTSSTLNFPMNDDRANAVTVALSGTGTLSATYAAPTSGPIAHVIFDVTGYFVP